MLRRVEALVDNANDPNSINMRYNIIYNIIYIILTYYIKRVILSTLCDEFGEELVNLHKIELKEKAKERVIFRHEQQQQQLLGREGNAIYRYIYSYLIPRHGWELFCLFFSMYISKQMYSLENDQQQEQQQQEEEEGEEGDIQQQQQQQPTHDDGDDGVVQLDDDDDDDDNATSSRRSKKKRRPSRLKKKKKDSDAAPLSRRNRADDAPPAPGTAEGDVQGEPGAAGTGDYSAFFEDIVEDAPEGEDEEDEDGDFGGRKKKKRRAPRSEKKAGGGGGGKKKGKSASDDPIAAAPRKPLTAAEEVFKATSDALKNRKSRGVNEPSHEQVTGAAQQLVSEMLQAYEKDRECNERQEPAFQKSLMLDSVKAAVQKSYLSDPLVEAGLLAALAKWLAPLPDGSAPSITLRTGVLEVLRTLQVDWSEGTALGQLKSSQLGKAIMHMSRTDDVPATRKLASDMVEIWSRPIFTINDDWRQLAREEEKRGVSSPMARTSGTSKLTDLDTAYQREIQKRVDERRKKPNTRASLYTGIGVVATAGESGLLRRPPRQKTLPEGGDQAKFVMRVAEAASQVMAGIHHQDEVMRTVEKASNLPSSKKK